MGPEGKVGRQLKRAGPHGAQNPDFQARTSDSLGLSTRMRPITCTNERTLHPFRIPKTVTQEGSSPRAAGTGSVIADFRGDHGSGLGEALPERVWAGTRPAAHRPARSEVPPAGAAELLGGDGSSSAHTNYTVSNL